jgi:prepilin signal peptidase PulO-like enzyme (type II secretory pathway)
LGAGVVQPGWPSSLLGGLATAALFLLPVLIFGSQRAGIGDVKLGLFVGLVLGFSTSLYWALLIAFGSGLLVGLVGILLKKWDRKSLLPFGPFLALGMVVATIFQVTGAGA